ncbi:DUF6274 family protein [Streptomyces sp. NPDC021093]|uniref:DUF6274 family protein n=1 Tax=Streptomyces sp. NPDC021093 TaxID=3365112 RepID=UPI00379154BF
MAKHETRALLRAHLAAASGYRHRTRHCPICHRLLLLALQPEKQPAGPPGSAPEQESGRTPAGPPERASEGQPGRRRTGAAAGPPPAQDESPPNP